MTKQKKTTKNINKKKKQKQHNLYLPSNLSEGLNFGGLIGQVVVLARWSLRQISLYLYLTFYYTL